MKIEVLTLFPEMFPGPLGASMIKRAQEQALVAISVVNIRDYAEGRHKVADDEPFGGGAGMVMKPEPIFAAVEAARCPVETSCRERVVLLTPQGRTLSQGIAAELAGYEHLILVCGHYEGVDERVRQHLVDDEISIGDYVLTGGELAALVVMDAVTRLVPGVLGAEEGAAEDSFAGGVLEYPQYTRPADFRGWQIPEMLLSGHHEQIRRWRRGQALRRTRERRPDLFEKLELTEEDWELLEE